MITYICSNCGSECVGVKSEFFSNTEFGVCYICTCSLCNRDTLVQVDPFITEDGIYSQFDVYLN